MAKKPTRLRESSASTAAAGKATPIMPANAGPHRRAVRASRRGRGKADALAAFVAAVPSIPAGELRNLFNYGEAFHFKPHTARLDETRMELDDVQVLRYLFRNARPRRHLEFGTWEGRGALACLEECDATVWTINLLEGERGKDGAAAYSRAYTESGPARHAGDYEVVGYTRDGIAEQRSYRTDAFGFIGRHIRDAGFGYRVCQIFADSRDWDVTAYPADFFDSVLIDGGHDAATVVNDTRKALSRLRPGGLVLWHDFCPDAGVYGNPDTSCHGVVSGLASIWDEVAAQLTAYRWVEGSWLLVGMRAGEPEVAPRLRKRDSAANAVAAGPRTQTALLASGVASLQRELDALAKFREERDTLNDDLMRARSENTALAKRVAGYSALVHERDLLVEQNDALRAQAREREALLVERDTLKKESADLRSEMAALELRVSSYARLTEERDAFSAKAERRDTEYEALSADLTRERGRLAEIAREREALSRKLNASRDGEAAARRNIGELEARLAQVESSARGALSVIDRLEEQLAARRQEIEIAATERGRLDRELAAREDRIDRLAAQEQDGRAKIAEMTSAIADRERRIDALEARVAELSETLSGRTRELDAQKEAMHGHNRQNEAQAAELAALKRSHEALAESRNALQADHAVLRRERDDIVSRLDEARAEYEAALAARAEEIAGLHDAGRAAQVELQAMIDRHEREIAALQRALADSTAERDGAWAEIEAARAATSRLQQSRRGLVAELADRNREIARLTDQQERLAGQIVEARARAETLAGERNRLLGSLTRTDRILQSAEAERNALRAERQELAAAQDRQRQRLDEVSAQRFELIGDIDRQKSLLAHFERVTAEIRRENESLRAIINDYATSDSWRLTAPLRMVSGLFRR